MPGAAVKIGEKTRHFPKEIIIFGIRFFNSRLRPTKRAYSTAGLRPQSQDMYI